MQLPELESPFATSPGEGPPPKSTKAFPCPYDNCEFGSNTKAGLTRHVNQTHLGKRRKGGKGKSFVCPECKANGKRKIFDRASDLGRHRLIKHDVPGSSPAALARGRKSKITRRRMGRPITRRPKEVVATNGLSPAALATRLCNFCPVCGTDMVIVEQAVGLQGKR